MANYFTLGYEGAASSSGSVELNNGFSESAGLAVQASLYAGSSFTPTHYKMWGVELVDGEGVVTVSGAQWLAFTSNRTVNLAYNNNPQNAYVRFKNADDVEIGPFQSNSVTFSFIEPRIHSSASWKTSFLDLHFDSAVNNFLVNNDNSFEVEISKEKIEQFIFSGSDFEGLRFDVDTIYVDPYSQFYKIIELNNTNHVTLFKTFTTSDTPLVMVDSGSGYTTLTAYDGTIKTTISGPNATRVDNVVWDVDEHKITFDVYKFSTYGFCNIQKVEFTGDSQTGAYVGNLAIFKVYVQDSNGEPVEAAPVTILGILGNIGSLIGSMPINTNAYGVAEFTLNVTSEGQAIFRATVDGLYTSTDDLVINGVGFPDAQRSLLSQYEQLRRSTFYDDTIPGVNTSEVAEPVTSTASGSSTSVLEHDLSVLRTLIKQIKGTSNWYDGAPSYFNPVNTDAVNVETGVASLDNIAGNTLDSKTIVIAVSDDNSGLGFSIAPGDVGFLFDTAIRYSTADDRRGILVYQSTTNSGTYYDEGSAAVVVVDLINLDTGGKFKNLAGDVVFAKFHDGMDYSGFGDGTDVYAKFYTELGPYTATSDDPTSIMLVYPVRRVMSEIEEHEWLRTDFISSWEGDSTIIDYVSNLWSYVGSSDNGTSPMWAVVSGSPIVSNSDDSLWKAINSINTEFGSFEFAENNYISSGQSITDILDSFDISLYDVTQEVTFRDLAEKYIQTLVSGISADAIHPLPEGLSYTPNSNIGREGSNMDVYLDGQLLSASTGVSGINSDRDYAETDTTHVTFHFEVYQDSDITYVIRA